MKQSSKGKPGTSRKVTKVDGQDRMTLAELEDELELQTNPSRMISLLQTIQTKAYGPKKQEYNKRLVHLYYEHNHVEEFLELAPSVLKSDSTDIDLRL